MYFLHTLRAGLHPDLLPVQYLHPFLLQALMPDKTHFYLRDLDKTPSENPRPEAPALLLRIHFQNQALLESCVPVYFRFREVAYKQSSGSALLL